jgi:hypothetical protein
MFIIALLLLAVKAIVLDSAILLHIAQGAIAIFVQYFSNNNAIFT